MGIADLFDISLDRANDLYAWGWRLSAFGAVITMIGIASLWIGTRVRDHDFESQMTSLNSASSQALERAGALEKDAATIRERAATAELRLEQLRNYVGPRQLQRDLFIGEITGQPNAPVEVMYLQDDPECFSLAQEIWRGLEDGKWPVEAPKPIPLLIISDGPTAMSVGGQPSGVTVVVKSITQDESQASENAMLGQEWVKTPWTVLMHAFGLSLGRVAGHVGGQDAPAEGRLRVVVSPKP